MIADWGGFRGFAFGAQVRSASSFRQFRVGVSNMTSRIQKLVPYESSLLSLTGQNLKQSTLNTIVSSGV